LLLPALLPRAELVGAEGRGASSVEEGSMPRMKETTVKWPRVVSFPNRSFHWSHDRLWVCIHACMHVITSVMMI
jgi:hypothetical protein